jgi:hypothetical protein
MPGDEFTLRGTFWTQTIELQGGETRTINHFTVTNIDVISRAPRKSIVIFER